MEDKRHEGRTIMRQAVDQVVSEREYQRNRWDDVNAARTPDEWVVILSIYLGKLARESPAYKGKAYDSQRFQQVLREIGALSICSLEMMVRPPGPIDSTPKS